MKLNKICSVQIDVVLGLQALYLIFSNSKLANNELKIFVGCLTGWMQSCFEADDALVGCNLEIFTAVL